MAFTAGTHSPASTIARRLAGGELFSAVAAELAGGPVACEELRRVIAHTLSPREAYLLEAHREGSGLVVRRSALLRGPAGAVAEVTAVYLPLRIPDPAVRQALWESDVPLGQALAPLGVRRKPVYVFNYRGRLRSAGLLMLGDTPTALAEEEFLPGVAV
jgi:hypothetical protein